MTPEQFNAKQQDLLQGVHPVLASALSWTAYERGHAYGYENVLSILSESIGTFAAVNKLLMFVPRRLEPVFSE